MRIRLIVISLLCLLAFPAASQASPRQVMSFEAPAELLDYSRVDVTLDEIKAFGVTQIRQLVYWQTFAPRPQSKKKPNVNLSDPDCVPELGAAGHADGFGARRRASR